MRRRQVRERNEEYFGELREWYLSFPIVLYAGAGVPIGSGLPDWDGLLARAAGTLGVDDYRESSSDPWVAADDIVAAKGNRALQKALERIIQDDELYRRSHGQLAARALEAATLRAVVAFSGVPSERVASRSDWVTFSFAPNRRLAAVLTTNFDCLLEAASTNFYRRPLLKPVAAKGSSAGDLDQIPVFHVHGYVPHPHPTRTRRGRRKQADRRPSVKDLVVTTEAYQRQWNREDAYGATIAPQIHLLRHYVTLFVGFSFRDAAVRGLLEELRREFQGTNRSHFAFVDGGTYRRVRARGFEAMGVRPIVWEDPGEIREWLGRLYCAGLERDHGKRVEIPLVRKVSHQPTGKRFDLSAAACWELARSCRNGMLRRERVAELDG